MKKNLATPLSRPLSKLFNFSLATGKVPLLWKEVNVTPIFTKAGPSVVSNYRPISLLSAVDKVLEKLYISIYLTIFVIMKFCLPYSQVSFLEIQH